jgi:hypothetical protein
MRWCIILQPKCIILPVILWWEVGGGEMSAIMFHVYLYLYLTYVCFHEFSYLKLCDLKYLYSYFDIWAFEFWNIFTSKGSSWRLRHWLVLRRVFEIPCYNLLKEMLSSNRESIMILYMNYIRFQFVHMYLIFNARIDLCFSLIIFYKYFLVIYRYYLIQAVLLWLYLALLMLFISFIYDFLAG